MTGDSRRFLCGWCGRATAGNPCSSCGRDSVSPWTQRGAVPPSVSEDPGRPKLDELAIRSQYLVARQVVIDRGRAPTIEAIAEQLDRSPRTVREWRRRFGLE